MRDTFLRYIDNRKIAIENSKYVYIIYSLLLILANFYVYFYFVIFLIITEKSIYSGKLKKVLKENRNISKDNRE